MQSFRVIPPNLYLGFFSQAAYQKHSGEHETQRPAVLFSELRRETFLMFQTACRSLPKSRCAPHSQAAADDRLSNVNWCIWRIFLGHLWSNLSVHTYTALHWYFSNLLYCWVWSKLLSTQAARINKPEAWWGEFEGPVPRSQVALPNPASLHENSLLL